MLLLIFIKKVRLLKSMEFKEVIKNRESVRSFSDKVVDQNVLDEILNAGRIAPSAKNKQPWRVYVIKSREAIDKIDMVTRCRYNAPLCLLVTSSFEDAYANESWNSYEMDGSIMATHMMLAAYDAGVDSIWIELFDKALCKELFAINEKPVCLLMLGYRTDDYSGNPLHNQRKNIEDIVTYL